MLGLIVRLLLSSHPVLDTCLGTLLKWLQFGIFFYGHIFNMFLFVQNIQFFLAVSPPKLHILIYRVFKSTLKRGKER